MMVNERGLNVHHATIYRWVQRYGPELEKRYPFNTARRTLKGYEIMHMIRKGQIEKLERGTVKERGKFIAEIFGVAA